MKRLLILLGIIAVGLLLLDRVIRLQPYLNKMKCNSAKDIEGFQAPVLSKGRARACGVGMEPCISPSKCGNGLCISTDPKPLVEKYPLPVRP